VPNKLLIGFSDEQLEELDKWRRNQEDLPTRSEVVRRLVDAGVQQKFAWKNWEGLSAAVVGDVSDRYDPCDV
jgi:metal-responsive CopG/Arc/MetJ family transcriptional regulator